MAYEGRHEGEPQREYVVEVPSDSQVQQADSRQGRRRSGYARAAASAPRRTANTITQRSSYSGKGLLTAELLAGFLLVGIRIVADFEVQGGGGMKGNVGHPQGQYGPLPILAGLIGSFFLLSFLAAAGGTKAKTAVILGGIIITTLGVNTLGEISKIATSLGTIGTVTVPPPSGSMSSVLGNLPADSAAQQQTSSAASAAANAASQSAQTIAGSNGLTYVAPTSLNALAHDAASAAQQALRQITPGGSTSIVQQAQSIVGSIYKKIFGGL